MNLVDRFRKRILDTIRKDLENRNSIYLFKGGYIHPSAVIQKATLQGHLKIEEGCKIEKGVKIDAKSEVYIGRYTSIMGPGTDILTYINPVYIGSFCSIARNVAIQEFNHKHDNLTTYHIHNNLLDSDRLNDIYSKGPINIGNDVWIGTQSVITSGSKICDGAVIGANSVVTGEIPPFAIAVGSPAKVIGYRFEEDIIKKIRKMKWWDWEIEKIKKHSEIFQNNEELKKFLDDSI